MKRKNQIRKIRNSYLFILIGFFTLILAFVAIQNTGIATERPIITSQDQWSLENVSGESQRSLFSLSESFTNKAVPTNNWYLPLMYAQNKDPIFVIPYSINFDGDKINFANTPKNVTSNLIHKPHIPEFGLKVSQIYKKELESVGDFSVKGNFLDIDNNTVGSITLSKGVPLTFLELNTKIIDLIFYTEKFSVETINENNLLIEVGENIYLISSSTLNSFKNNTLSFKEDKNYITVSLLPSKDKVSNYIDIALNRVVDTKVELTVRENQLEAEYRIFTNNGKDTLYGLIPSLLRNVSQMGETLNISFDTLRGTQEIFKGQSYKVNLSIPQISDEFQVDLSLTEIEELENFLKDDSLEVPNSGSYFAGKDLFRLSNMYAASNLLENKELFQTIENTLLSELKNWFSYSVGETSKYFEYNRAMGGIIGRNAEFGSEGFNDHHFHYGHFIYSMAMVCRINTDFCSEYKGIVELLIKNIASEDRKGEVFPRFRVFDFYEGHSWASGTTTFGDGNNQESVSEAINAWYAIYLFGKATNNSALENLGISLYTIEIESAKNYWWNYYSDQSIFPKEYEPGYASLVWGGKVEEATFFSSRKEASMGIIVIPVSGGSGYIYNPAVAKRLISRLSNVEAYPIFDDLINQYKMINQLEYKSINKWSLDPINSKGHSYLLSKVYK